MGLLGGLGRLLQGKPVFEAPPPEGQQTDQQPPQVPGAPQQQAPGAPQAPPAGPKERPVAVISWVKCWPNGSNMRCNVIIKNNSSHELMMDKVLLMGQTRDIDRVLRAGESYKFLDVYNGPKPNHRNYNTATLQYHEGGDYFQTHHTVEFNQEPDGTYSIARFRVQLPVRDI